MPNVDIKDSADSLATAAKLAGEVLVPGASDLISGHVGGGVATFLATGLLVTALAPTMPILATLAAVGLRVNSFRHATTGQYFWSGVLPSATDHRPPDTRTTRTST